VSPRQRIRLCEVRKSDYWNDQHTPAEIELAESASADEQDVLQYLLSQVRQITGQPKWYNPVPVTLENLYRLPVHCTPIETVATLVYVSGGMTDMRYEVRTADPTDFSKLPAIGMIVAKDDIRHAYMQYIGPVTGVFGVVFPELVVGKTYFLGLDGQITLTAPMGEAYIQKIGIALDKSVLLLTPDLTLVRRRAHL